MSLLSNIFIIILYIATAVSIYGFNTVRPNEVIFNTGHYIRDDVNTEAGMISPIPKNVCYKKTLKAEPVECEYNYAQYYTSFVSNPVPGTINIGINVNPDEDARKLRIMVGSYDGEFATLIPIKGSIQGFNSELVNPGSCNDSCNLAMYMYNPDGGEKVKQNITGTSQYGLPSAFTNLQVGSSRYGESVWIYNDSDEETLTLGGFEAVDFSLEPTNPQEFSINAIRQTSSNATNFYPPGVTYLTDHVRIQDIDGNGGEVCINQDATTFDHCKQDQQGLFIKGDVVVGKLFGLVGFVQYRTGKTDDGGETAAGNLPASENSLEVYLDVNMDGCKGTIAAKYPIGSDRQSDCQTPDDEATDVDKVTGYMVSYIGYLKAKQKHNYTGLFWMEIHNDSGKVCQTTPDADASTVTHLEGISNTGLFDYQNANWNENASFTFLFVEAFAADDNTEVDVSRYIKFCNRTPHVDYATISQGLWNETAVKYRVQDSGDNSFEFGVAVYGIPVTTQQ
tara:strand:- start:88 stop:1608 length:1521 start_codon:yes stop_codon:yes gene_type:complete